MTASDLHPLGEGATPASSAVPHASTTEVSYIPALDGVRGLAILLVMILHFLYSDRSRLLGHLAGVGWVGVDLFFVLSGFLITRILRSAVEAPRFFSGFYARRALRIWPLYYTTLAFAFGATRALPVSMAISPDLLPYYATFTQNIFRPHELGPWAIAGTWSLAIEEQFYLIWPLCVRRFQRRTLIGILSAVMLVVPVIRVIAFAFGSSPCTIYISCALRADSLAAGALVALFFNSSQRARLEQLSGKVASVALALAFTLCATLVTHGLIISGASVTMAQGLAMSLTYSLLAVGFAAMIACAATAPEGRLARTLSNSTLRFLGRISFGLYLIQGLVIPLSQTLLRRWLVAHVHSTSWIITVLVMLIGLGSTLALALISWRFFESRVLRFRRYFKP